MMLTSLAIRRPRRGRAAALLFIAACAAALSGCGDGRPRCYPVKGKILVDSKPMENVFIWLTPVVMNEDEPLTGYGQTDKNGDYTIASFLPGDGAPVGEYIITFDAREASGLLKNQFDGPDKLGEAYSDKSKSTFRCKVEAVEENVLTTYDLKSPASK